MGESSEPTSSRRRTLLRSLAVGGSLTTVGCMRRLRAASGWESVSPVSVEIVALPADADPYALRVAQSVARWFRAAGLRVAVTPVAPEELYRRVLIRNDFDAFVGRVPARLREPDGLYALLHSRFGSEPGWQNPFGYANLDVDERLTEARSATGEARTKALAAAQHSIARTQPFALVAFPDAVRAVRGDRFAGWTRRDYRSPLGYLALDAAPDRPADAAATARTAPDGPAGTPTERATAADDRATTPTDPATLRVVITDRRPTENLNPLAAEFRWSTALTGLLYDRLGRETGDGRVEPWLADGWEFETVDGRPRARVRLRDDLVWHDDEPVTAADVAFTYALFSDVTLGRTDESAATPTESEAAVAAPRFRGRSSLVADAEALDRRTVEIRFVDCTAEVATRALAVPVLPEHVWRERTGPASVGGVDFGAASEVLVSNNVPPVGSGPFTFERNVPGDRLVLERDDDHFLADAAPTDLPGEADGLPSYERIDVTVVGADETAVSMVANGDADVTGTAVGAETIPRIGRAEGVDLVVGRSASPYVLGYNTRRPPLTNPRFRNTLGHLVDRRALVEDVFDGYAWPAASPLAGTGSVSSDLRFEDGHPVTPFLGSDGTIDAAAARAAFREAGYEYDDGTLVGRD
ncbi:extracellular solute-binding protein family 5 [Halosimplex carlsbadense 2-9-1]|uniref:Extracellular solute-binding protein family 5 n=1 Tax=Halosimplex carlsbadense 2-9-1 TaxID=797114 RepID=M0CXC5_9EURY|nr:ABC transporter substrate-binding protein [Halosimplex carlsbadense]ELZ27870.1 extracellular solute-binding protein family 5 [Halosimplex carlsbadense 2-9-1]